MTQEYVAAAVITNEIDETELAAGLAAIGPSVITAASKGPAFRVTPIGYWPDCVAKFGRQDSKRLGLYAARLGLKTLANINIVRVLGPAGTTHTNGSTIYPGFKVDKVYGINTTGSTAMAIVHVSGAYSCLLTDLTNGKFYMEITNGTAVVKSYGTASFNSGASDYITNVFNEDPTLYHDANYGYYIYKVFQYDYRNNVANPEFTASVWAAATYGDYTMGYSSGSTPWFKSQPFGGSQKEYNLFRLHTIGDGTNENKNVKVTISNVQPSVSPDTTPYGTFDVIVRSYGDNDSNMQILEQFSNLTFDDSSPRYVARMIGDAYEQYDASLKKFVPYGSYEIKSKYVRVEVTGSSFPDTALPWGFRGFGKMSASIPALPYVYDLKNTSGIYSSRLAWGIQFNSGNLVTRFDPRPSGKAEAASDDDFSLKSVSGSTAENYAYNTVWTGTLPSSTFATYAKFTTAFEGGWDGWDIHQKDPIDNTLLINTTNFASASWTARNAFRRAIDVLSNADEVDTDMLVIPGVFHEFVTDYAIDMVEDRADMFYVTCISGNTCSDAINYVAGRAFDTSYAGCYYPHVLIEDTDNSKRVYVDPSTIMPYVYGKNAALGQPYYAPAGFNRAILDGVVFGVKEILDKDDRNDLYRNRINPIARFKEGYVVWGQKTLQIKETSLNRINVRLLLLHVKKAVASIAKYLVFEQNVSATWQKFENLCRPILDQIVAKYGIKRYKIQMDASTVTKEHEERNEMPGKIVIQPVRAAEVIPIDFILSENGASFE